MAQALVPIWQVRQLNQRRTLQVQCRGQQVMMWEEGHGLEEEVKGSPALYLAVGFEQALAPAMEVLHKLLLAL